MKSKIILEKLKEIDMLIECNIKGTYGYSPTGWSHYDLLIEEKNNLLDQLKEVDEASWKTYIKFRY
jgi:hypothetical protein